MENLINNYCIDYFNKFGHDYCKANWSDNITKAWSNKKIRIQNGLFMSKEDIKNTVSQKSFQSLYDIYKCNKCKTLVLFDNAAVYSIILIINNIFIRYEPNIPEKNSLNKDVMLFKKYLEKDEFHITL